MLDLDGSLVILNPAAGRGSAVRAWRAAEAVLRKAGVRFDLARTDGPRHAEVLAAQAARSGRPAVLAVGGDGTVNEVANGLLRAAEGSPTLPMGVITAGTGNDFIKMLGIPADAVGSARTALRATTRQVDAGLVNDRFFTNGVGVGFDARVAARARDVRRLRGLAVYAWAVARAIIEHRNAHVRIQVDGAAVADQQVTLVTVANGGCHGGGFWLCPDARPDDGCLDVLIADALPRTGVMRFIPRVLRRTHTQYPNVHMHRARQVEITSREPLPVHADGEPLEPVSRLEIEILPGRLTVLV